jgi:thiosulfate dehydrogenase [quinone] large subunit
LCNLPVRFGTYGVRNNRQIFAGFRFCVVHLRDPSLTDQPNNSMSDKSCSSHCCPRLDLAFANLITRLWVALRLLMAGVDKFRSGDGAAATFNVSNYETKTNLISKLMTDNSFLPAFLPPAAIDAYAHGIGYALLFVGVWVALGLYSELSLFAAGLTFLSLGFGLAALPDDTELGVNIGIGIIITYLALTTAKHGFLSLDGILRGKKKTANA